MKNLIFTIFIGLSFMCFTCNSKNIESSKSNNGFTKATVTKYNAEKCMCCQHWTLQVEDMLLFSNDQKIGKSVGYNFNEKPIEVLVKFGEWDNCKHRKILEIKRF